ncbi:hypothetical protein PIB30_064180 [Stylosanthes scabra]|uniref:Uncharacterized protein n=1 Tax=Stylosanthes scabra TaxID=79078 RepID=A0ABU6ZKD5_9FABA|nr:hypothetical protein [Stylosanthes scabra]
MRSHREIYTWRSAVPVVCFNFVHMHHVDRVLRQYDGEQPVPRAPVDVTRFMSSTGRGDDVWWPERLATWYEGWRGRGSPQVLVTVHEGDLRGTQRYYEWFAATARHGRFLSRAVDLADPRWNMAPPGIPPGVVYPRDELVMPEDAPAPRRRGEHQPRPRQAAPARGKLSRRDQRRRARMVVVDDEDRAEEQQQYDGQDEPGEGDGGEAAQDDQPRAQTHEQPDYDPHDRGISPSTMISFSPCRYPSPHQEGTSSIVNTFRMTRAQHSDPGGSGPWCPTYSSPPVMGTPAFEPRTIRQEWETPPSYDAPSSYHSQSYDRHSPPPSTMDQAHQTTTELDHPTTADHPQPSPTGRPRRETRHPTCGTGGHIRPPRGRH